MTGSTPHRTVFGCSDSNAGAYPFTSLDAKGGGLSGVPAVKLSVEPCISSCGNGVQECVEDCDDNNTLSGDGCSSSCMREPGWVCSEQAAAPTVCWQCSCGDGIVECEESCDDNNTISGDGCSSGCTVEPLWLCDSTGSVGTSSVCQSGRVAIESIPRKLTEHGTPFNVEYHDQRFQSLYLASELQAAGLPDGYQIDTISLRCSVPPHIDIKDFRVAYATTNEGHCYD
jgi:cysteine-rich repeat protein